MMKFIKQVIKRKPNSQQTIAIFLVSLVAPSGLQPQNTKSCLSGCQNHEIFYCTCDWGAGRRNIISLLWVLGAKPLWMAICRHLVKLNMPILFAFQFHLWMFVLKELPYGPKENYTRMLIAVACNHKNEKTTNICLFGKYLLIWEIANCGLFTTGYGVAV